MNEQRQKMIEGGSIRDVFSSPQEVGSFIRSILTELEEARNESRIKEQAAARRLDELRHELHNQMCAAQRRLNFTMSDL
jgi:aspartate/tyrosine/aromatic aminotransferase